MELEFLADNDELERLELHLAASAEFRLVELLLPVAWQLRQRDPSRALVLADETESALRASGLSDVEQLRVSARLQLIYAEVHWLRGDLDMAQVLLDAAMASLGALNDSIGQGDAEWLAVSIFGGRGDPEQHGARLRSAQHHYAAGADSVRLAAAQARFVFHAALSDPVAARSQLTALCTTQLPSHPLVEAWVLATEGVVAGMSGHHGPAASAFLRGYYAFLKCGSLERAVNCANNAAAALSQLNDLAGSLGWNENALTLARQIGNPAQIAVGCAAIGDVLRRLHRPSEALARLHEARESLLHLPAHPNHLQILEPLAGLALEGGDYSAALAWAEQGEMRARELQQREYQVVALRHQARALGRLGRVQEALVKVTGSLVLAQETGNAGWEMEALCVLAELHRQHDLPAPHGMTALSPALHYLQQALALAHRIEGFLLPPDVLDLAAADYAAVGDLANAYALAREAKQAQVTMHSKEASDRADAMQVRFELDRLRADTQHHRQLAESWRLANATLQDLGQIGMEITASLHATSVVATLASYVHNLLDAASFGIFLLDEDGCTLVSVLNKEAGQDLPVERIPLDDPHSNTARCAREGTDIVILEPPATVAPTHISGTLVMLSLMYAPLSVGSKLLGAMTIQSPEANAYGKREVAIFRTLCSYGAIALANAQTMDALKKTQSLLIQQEKLASLGSMVAGISHELNTPIGNALVMSTTLEHNIKTLSKEVEDGQLRRSRLDSFLTNGVEVSGLITQSIQRATTLIAGFKQVAIDQTSEERRSFDLRSVIVDSTVAMRALCANQSIQVAIDVPQGIECDTFPGLLGAVLGKLLQNCRLHAFDNSQTGTVSILSRIEGDHVFLDVSDNGAGMSPYVVSHVFDPFFTTKLGQGGSGIGLSVAHRIATTVLAGDLTATSAPGEGSTFTLRFAKRAPFPL